MVARARRRRRGAGYSTERQHLRRPRAWRRARTSARRAPAPPAARPRSGTGARAPCRTPRTPRSRPARPAPASRASGGRGAASSRRASSATDARQQAGEQRQHQPALGMADARRAEAALAAGASPTPTRLERREHHRRRALHLGRTVEVVAQRVGEARRRTAPPPRRRPAASTAASAAAPCSAARRSPRATSQASATGATTSGNPFVSTARPSTASRGARPRRAEQQQRAERERHRAPGRSGCGSARRRAAPRPRAATSSPAAGRRRCGGASAPMSSTTAHGEQRASSAAKASP